jgi:hypothetical protein
MQLDVHAKAAAELAFYAFPPWAPALAMGL